MARRSNTTAALAGNTRSGAPGAPSIVSTRAPAWRNALASLAEAIQAAPCSAAPSALQAAGDIHGLIA